MLEKILKIEKEKKNNYSDTEAVCNRGDSKNTQTETHYKFQLNLATERHLGMAKCEDIKVNLLLVLKKRPKETHFVPFFTEQGERESSKPERIQRKKKSGTKTTAEREGRRRKIVSTTTYQKQSTWLKFSGAGAGAA